MADHIQIGDISPRIQYSGDGAQTVFTYPFPVFVDANIDVYEDTGLKTITTDYAVSGAGNSSGGTVTFVSAPATGVVVTLLRNLAIERTSDFQESGEFRAKVINDELDKIVAGVQQVETDQGRALRLSTTDSATTTAIPDKATRSGKVLVFDSNGDPSVSTEDIAAIEGAATSAAAAAVDAAAADADATTATTKAAEAAASAALALGATTGKYDAHININDVDSPYTLASLTADTLITVTTTGGGVIINLPSASGEADNRLLGINKNGAANTITINPSGADTIGGAASFVQYDDTEWADLYLDKANTNWQLGNLSFTAAGNGMQKVGSTISLKPIVVAAICIGNETTAISAGAGIVSFHAPIAFNLTNVVAGLNVAQTSGLILTFDINKAGVSILSTKLSVDNAEDNSTTALTPAVLSDTAIAAGEKLTIDVDQIGDGAATGGKIYLIGYPS